MLKISWYFLLILKHRICLLFSLAANFCDGIQLRFYRAFISNPTQRFKSLEWPNDWRQNAWKVTSQLEYLYQYWGFWILLNYLHAFRYSGLLFLHYSCSFIFLCFLSLSIVYQHHLGSALTFKNKTKVVCALKCFLAHWAKPKVYLLSVLLRVGFCLNFILVTVWRLI